MICATILFCYLFTCCITTTTSLASAPATTLASSLDAPPSSLHFQLPPDYLSAAQSAPHGAEPRIAADAGGQNGGQLGPQQDDDHEAPIIDYVKDNNVHKLMSEQDLRRTFQVDSHDQVPEYEILKLTVNDDGSHLISPVSDLGEFVTTTHNSINNNINNNNNDKHKYNDNLNNGAPSSRTSNATTRTSARAEEEEEAATNREDADEFKSTPAKHNRNKRAAKREQESSGDDDGDKLIVMNLSTFGQDFKLRLKRNVDFQQRIKDMKMFMAESTGGGQLRYTEIKSGHHRQEPHKRAAGESGAEDEDAAAATTTTTTTTAKPTPAETPATTSTTTTTTTTTTASTQAPTQSQGQKSKGNQAPGRGGAGQDGNGSGASHWTGIGSTYHDEDNLAALLIDQDSKTGQLQVDGTIGNDFVIKPMPQATIDALLAKRAQELAAKRRRQLNGRSSDSAVSSSSPAGVGMESLANVDLERSSSAAAAAVAKKQQVDSKAAAAAKATNLAQHMHDDDPHDDDEMFLDEDEALEMAHLQQSAQVIESNHTSSVQRPHSGPARPLSKQASERKWRKYRKLIAQTRVPKPGALAGDSNQQQQQQPNSATTSSFKPAARARRHASQGADQSKRTVQISHHIIYRQRPSSEASSSDHQHSFMAAPQLYEPSAASMEQMAVNFAPQRLGKRHARADQLNLEPAEDNQDADFLEDPLGGQFYLEPGLITGTDRAGFSDWRLLSGAGAVGYRAGGRALPPYAQGVNASEPELGQARANGTRTRYKRDTPMRARASQVRRKRQAPETVWPEVLLVVDYDSFLLHNGDSRDVKRYFVSFWNGVDLRYKLLVHPHIRISLAGMIVAKDRDATPYLERNRLRAPNADAVDAAGALTDMGKYLYREDRLPTYDLAVVITKLDMCRRRYEGGRCNRGTAGFAYVGGACVVNKRLEKVNSVAIIEDSGGFSGIIVAAHEVGHLLGCVHDGSPPPSYLGGPGATHCPWEEGYIMSDLRHTERGFRWSQCSVEQFKHFLNGETATCLYNFPHEHQPLQRLLPGTMLTLDDQCKRDRGTNACFKDARVCAQLFCFDSASGYCVSYRPAAEGSPCGEGQVCRNGKCVGEIENIIPDYTHQSQTVIARRPTHTVGRLADNGLSASSTSLATSSPDSKLTVSSAGGVSSAMTAPLQQRGQISRRMDTFPVYTPIVTGTSQSASPYPTFGSRFSSTRMWSVNY